MSIGNFDGVHLGHQALMHCARRLAGPDGRVVVLSFDPHPISRLRPEHTPGILTTFEQRRQLLRAAGADEVIRLTPERELLDLEPAEFVSRIVQEHQPGALAEGWNFRFGHQRRGDVEMLREFGHQYGFAVEIVEPIETSLSNQLLTTVSSTLVRWLIRHGRVADAGRLLGRPYAITGPVVAGNKRGRTIGFPTANLSCPNILPAPAVYACRAIICPSPIPGQDGRIWPAAVNVGSRPTFGSGSLTCEAHLIGYKGPLDQYGWTLTLEFLTYLRDEAKFTSVETLVEQIQVDTRRAAEIFVQDTAFRTDVNSAVRLAGDGLTPRSARPATAPGCNAG